MIDAHVHLRDFNQSEKETIEHGLKVAKIAGFQRVFDMPNTNPALTSKDVVLDRLSLASESVKKNKVSYHLYMGLTNDEEQIKEAVNTYFMLFPLVVGLKMFLGQSTGNMGIVSYSDQEKVVKCLTSAGYDGVLTVHAEKESLMKSELYIKGRSETHSLSRPNESEIESISDIIKIVKETGFKGKLHIAHISTKGGVEKVLEARKEGLNVYMGATPHHALLNIDDAKNNPLLKVNPPLRSEEDRAFIYECLLNGTIDSIESDHAPHTLENKENGASGLPGFGSMLVLLNKLKSDGVSEEKLKLLFGLNVLKEFNLDEEDIFIPRDEIKRKKKIEKEYPFDPFSSFTMF